MMRILHISAGNLFGGVETLLATLARSRGRCPEMLPHFALCFEGRLAEVFRQTAVPVHMLGPVRVSRPWTVGRARRNLAKLLQQIAFDVVICHSVWPMAIFGPVVRGTRMPLVFWLHDTARGTHWLERWARRTAPDVAVCSSRFTAITLKNLYPAPSCEVIYCP